MDVTGIAYSIAAAVTVEVPLKIVPYGALPRSSLSSFS